MWPVNDLIGKQGLGRCISGKGFELRRLWTVSVAPEHHSVLVRERQREVCLGDLESETRDAGCHQRQHGVALPSSLGRGRQGRVPMVDFCE